MSEHWGGLWVQDPRQSPHQCHHPPKGRQGHTGLQWLDPIACNVRGGLAQEPNGTHLGHDEFMLIYTVGSNPSAQTISRRGKETWASVTFPHVLICMVRCQDFAPSMGYHGMIPLVQAYHDPHGLHERGCPPTHQRTAADEHRNLLPPAIRLGSVHGRQESDLQFLILARRTKTVPESVS